MSDKSESSQLPGVHPTLEKVPADARVLSGYVGRSESTQSVRLLPSLKDQEHSLEFAQSDIVHFESDGASKDGRVNIWLKPSAPVSVVTVQRVVARELPRGKRKLTLSAETVKLLRSGRRTGPQDTEACISGENRCTEGAGDCTVYCSDSDDMGCTWSMPC